MRGRPPPLQVEWPIPIYEIRVICVIPRCSHRALVQTWLGLKANAMKVANAGSRPLRLLSWKYQSEAGNLEKLVGEACPQTDVVHTAQSNVILGAEETCSLYHSADGISTASFVGAQRNDQSLECWAVARGSQSSMSRSPSEVSAASSRDFCFPSL